MIAIDKIPVKKRISLGDDGDLVLVDASDLGSLGISGSREPDRNVLLVDGKGQIVWQIEAATGSHGAVGYSDVYLGESDSLLAYSSNGIEYTIDKATGRVLRKELIR